MTASRRTLALIVTALLLLAAMALVSIESMRRAQRAAQRAGDDLVACQALSEAILALRSRPTIASTADRNPQEIGRRIQEASEFVGLAPQMLQSVSPGQPQRVGQSPYLLKPTVLSLRQMPLEQLAVFLFTLSNGTGLTVQQLRLRTPAAAGDGLVWDADATLTYLVYAPQASNRREP